MSPKTELIEHTLRNGLKVLLQPARTAPIVSVWCWYKVGSSYERPGITGISHWLEHMNFKGTRKFSKEDMKSLIEKRGGYWNGYTWIDQTTYFETLPKEHLGLALELEAERMSRSVIDAAEFESERSVILSELHMGENSPESILDKEVTASVFSSHGYRWPTVGWEPDVERMAHQDMVDFYREHYVPSNATLVVAGDFSPVGAMKKIRRLFGGIPSGERSDLYRTPEMPQQGERRVSIEGGGSTTYLHVAYRAPSVNDENVYCLLLFDAIIGGAKGTSIWSYDGDVRKSSPLYKELVDKRIATGIRSFYIPTRDPFLYYFSATAAAGVSLAKLEQKLFRVLHSVASKTPTKRELEKAKNQIRAMSVFQSDSVTEIAHQLGYFETIQSHRFVETFRERIEAVTAAQVRDFGQEILRRRNRTVGTYVPGRNGKGGRG